MTPLILSVVAICAMMFVGMPIALALGATGVAWILLLDPRQTLGIAHAMWNTTSGDVLISVPLFILMGVVAELSHSAQRFYSASQDWVRRIPGGLIHSNILGCGVFSAVSGSALATASTIGSAAIPTMSKLRYDRKLMFGSLAAGGTLGILIPPSIPLLIYAGLTDVSPGRLFMGTIVPGLIAWLAFHAYVLIRSSVGSTPNRGGGDSALAVHSGLLRSLLDIMPLVSMVGVVIWSIYSGWATALEVAGIGTAMAIVIAIVSGTFSMALMRDALVKTVRLTASIMFIVIGSQAYSVALFASGLAFELVDLVRDSALGPYTILLIILGGYLILGTFIDELSMMLLSIAMVHPIIVGLGFDPVWFAALLVITLQVGLISPPVGLTLFVIKAIAPANTTLAEIAWGTVPFGAILLGLLLLLVLVPDLVLWLPSTM